ncbi:MAG: MarC family protein [Hyphomicrobiaceae bacterium]
MFVIETALKSFTTFLATVGPVEAAVLFATLTPRISPAARRGIAIRASVIATIILLIFTVLGGPLLSQLGVSLAALQTAGGIILLMLAIDMVFARPGSSLKLTPNEDEEAHSRDDMAVFPLATPLLAGPGAMSAGIVLTANAAHQPFGIAVVVAALLSVMALTLALLIVAHEFNSRISLTAQRVLVRVFGILLAAIAVQSVFNGIAASGLLRA